MPPSFSCASARFISKQKSTARAVLFCLEVQAGYSPMAKISRLLRRLASGHRLKRRICEPDSLCFARRKVDTKCDLRHQNKKDTPRGCPTRFRPGIHAKREDTHTLRLKSELFDLRVGYVNRTLLRLGSQIRFKLGLCPTKTKRTLLAGVLLFWRCRPDLNRRITVLQTGALPLGYCTKFSIAYVLYQSFYTLSRGKSIFY